MDKSLDYILTIAAVVIGIMLMTGHGSFFMKGGNQQSRARRYDEKKMEKWSGICLLIIGIGTGVNTFTTSLTAQIIYVVFLIVMCAIYGMGLKKGCVKKN